MMYSDVGILNHDLAHGRVLPTAGGAIGVRLSAHVTEAKQESLTR